MLPPLLLVSASTFSPLSHFSITVVPSPRVKITCPSRMLSRKNPSLWSPEAYLNQLSSWMSTITAMTHLKTPCPMIFPATNSASRVFPLGYRMKPLPCSNPDLTHKTEHDDCTPVHLPVLPGVHGPVPEAGGPVPLPLPLDPLASVVDPDNQWSGHRMMEDAFTCCIYH